MGVVGLARGQQSPLPVGPQGLPHGVVGGVLGTVHGVLSGTVVLGDAGVGDEGVGMGFLWVQATAPVPALVCVRGGVLVASLDHVLVMLGGDGEGLVRGMAVLLTGSSVTATAHLALL